MFKPLNQHVGKRMSVGGLQRHKFFSVLFFLLLSFAVSPVYAQRPDLPPDPGEICNIPSCTTGSINISTGYNQSTGTYQTPLASETNWQLVAVPSDVSISVPAPSYVITPAPGAWSLFPNAKWVSPYTHWQHQVNNLPVSQGGTGPYRFQKCFCLCQPTQVHFQYSLLADDQAETFVDGIKLANGLYGGHYAFPDQLEVDTVITLGAGQHCISVDLYNVGLSAFGFSLEGTISGTSLVSPLCCNAKGNICGYKLKDMNCDGDVDPSADPGVAGFTITLYNISGTPIASTVTDANGHYCFNDLSPATYTVAEVNQPGWTQSYPASGSHTVVVPPSGSVTANFGNCPPACEAIPDPFFKADIDRCMARFTPDIGTMPFGYQVVSYSWVFGDGYSSNEQHPTHSYLDVGSYDVCLKVVFFNGEQCCTKEFCERVDIADKCEGGCKFETEIGYIFNEEECLYDFFGHVSNADAPITTWFWDFGDGTTANGSQVFHQFPHHGEYTVCLYQFATTDGECCYEKVCRDIRVECDPETHHGAMKVAAPAPVNLNNKMQAAPQKKYTTR